MYLGARGAYDTKPRHDRGAVELPDIPEELALLPIFNNIVYPMTIIPLAIGQEQSIKLIDDALMGGRMIGLVSLRNTDARPEHVRPEDFYTVGCAASVHRLLKMPDGTLRVAVQGV